MVVSLFCLIRTTGRTRIGLLVHFNADVIIVSDLLLLFVISPVFLCSFGWPMLLIIKNLIIIWSSKKELKGFTWKKERIPPIGNDSAHAGKFGSRVDTVCRCRFSPNTIEKHLLHSSPVKEYTHEHLPLNFSAEVVLPQRRWPKDVVLAQHAVDVEDGPSPIDWTATACGRKGKQSTMDHWSIETDLMSIGSLGFSGHRQQCHLKVVRPVLMKSHLMKRSSSKDCCWDYCCCCLSNRCWQ